jgi:signal transduction histidine kinase
MYKKLLTLSFVILIAMAGLTWLGYQAIEMQQKGLQMQYEGLQMQQEGLQKERAGEFASVTELIRRDVKRKLDSFLEKEEKRDYAEYQQYYVREDVVAANTILPIFESPLNGSLEQGLAYGHFQINPEGKIITPFNRTEPQQTREEIQRYVDNVKDNILPSVSGQWAKIQFKEQSEPAQKVTQKIPAEIKVASNVDGQSGLKELMQKKINSGAYGGKGGNRGQSFPIQSFQNPKQKTQIYNRQRSNVDVNYFFNDPEQQRRQSSGQQQQSDYAQSARSQIQHPPQEKAQDVQAADVQNGNQTQPIQIDQQRLFAGNNQLFYQTPVPTDNIINPDVQQFLQPSPQTQGTLLPQPGAGPQAEMVQIRVEPFFQLIAPNGTDKASVFDGQIFLLRHILIENDHIIQGFKLNEKKLIEEVQESAGRLVAEGMQFAVSRKDDPQAAFAGILDFGFGELILNLSETDPGWISRQINLVRTQIAQVQGQISSVRRWYFGIVGVVLLVVGLGVVSLWRNVQEQVQLAQKKDDFISAVSHELRTPLTSIRMYTEMLEKGWLKTEDKRNEYYLTMRQESERLSRLIENVLDFSRIQRGSKQYNFQLGDINSCVQNVVDMMRTYAGQKGFTIHSEYLAQGSVAFDSDAVMQIVINLLDNTIKYAGKAEDKTIFVRTNSQNGYVWIEVEDRGPGVPHRQRKKVFDEFYRCEAEATRENTGAGLGLALVRKFAQAHNGFVEILNAQPTGALFRVGLSLQK